jgi:hypothetical protein
MEQESAMTRHRVSASLCIDAPAERVYSIIADYQHGHAQILPRPPFVSMAVTHGGFGAGTEIDLAMRIMGKVRTYHGVVSEPEAGRVIAERYVGTDLITTFTVDPLDGGRRANVTISTDAEVGTSLMGLVGRWIATRMLEPVYTKELDRLAVLAAAAPS